MIYTTLVCYKFLNTQPTWEILKHAIQNQMLFPRKSNNMHIAASQPNRDQKIQVIIKLLFLPLYQSAFWCFKGIFLCVGLPRFTKYAQEKTFTALQDIRG